jgi:mannose-6-phosphate isomerase-like protein (cupin superfamily)
MRPDARGVIGGSILLHVLLALLVSLALPACSTRDAQSVNAMDTTEAKEKPPVAAGADTGRSTGGGDLRVSSPGGTGVVEYYTAAALAHIGDSLARGSTSGHMLRAHGTYQYLQIRRGRSGVPEVHDRWTDVTMVQAGRATLLSGGRVSGSHVESPGEQRGGTIAGGTSRPVGPGDLMIIPAGIPHQYLIAPGDSLRYLTAKVLQTPGTH